MERVLDVNLSSGMEVLTSYSNDTKNNMSTPLQPTSDGDLQFEFIVYRIIVPLFYGSVSLVGLIGNILVIYVILSRTKMQTVINISLLNLAFADLVFVVVMPTFTAYTFSDWPFGDSVCKSIHYLANVTVYVEVYTLVLISVFRYMTIVHHMTTLQIRTKQNIIFMIIALWIVMLTLNIPVILSYEHTEMFPNTYACLHYSIGHGQRFFTVFFIFAYVLPLLAISILSICILHHIREQKLTMVDSTKQTRSSMKKKQASCLIIMVVIIFAILWLPTHIHLLVAFYGNLPKTKAYQALGVLWNFATYLNSCINPFIYNLVSQEFRQAYHEIMCSLGCRGSQRATVATSDIKLTNMAANKTSAVDNNEENLNQSQSDQDILSC